MIREMIGEESPSEEFEAYSIQGIFYKLMKEYRKREKKSKRDAQLKKEQEDKANKQAFEEDLKT
jgi:hypothetical protein